MARLHPECFDRRVFKDPAHKGNVAVVDTRPMYRDQAVSPSGFDQWAVVRIGKPADPAYFVTVPSGGIQARNGMRTGSADCDLYELDNAGEIQAVKDPAGETVRITARNHSAQRIRGPVDGSNADQ